MSVPRNTRVYSRSRTSTALPSSPSSSQTDPTSSPPCTPAPRKRPLSDVSSLTNSPPKKRKISKSLSSSKSSFRQAHLKSSKKQPTLTQLHLLPDQPILRECKECGLSYTRAAVEDERIHKTHCLRVRKGMEWGREDERAFGAVELQELAAGIKLKNGKTGRVVCFRANLSGKTGRKLTTLLETVNLALSSPALTPDALRTAKAYLFLLPSSMPSRESIVGVVIAQRISSAMAITSLLPSSSDVSLIPVHIDCTTSLYLHPKPLPTPLGISRVFVSSAYRRQGIAHHLLDAAARTFVHGCELDPRVGEVAFSQPTAMGCAVMRSWGAGGVRIYQE